MPTLEHRAFLLCTPTSVSTWIHSLCNSAVPIQTGLEVTGNLELAGAACASASVTTGKWSSLAGPDMQAVCSPDQEPRATH
jgi:hypothetical protein